MANNRNALTGIILIFCLCSLSCTQSKIYRQYSGSIWHTSFNIQYESSKNLNDSILKVLNDVEMSLSAFNDSSTISRVNRNSEPVECDLMLAEVFNESKRINEISSGAFDPTVGPLVDLWGFGRNRDSVSSVSQSEIDSVLSRVGIADCRIDKAGRLIKKHPDTEFNFSAIAKGYACDKIADMFIRNGLGNFLIEVGGEIVARGYNHETKLWRIMIEAPVIGARVGIGVMEVEDMAVATSGNYRNYREINGRIVSHTISPFTGRPVNGDLLAVTVTAPECVTADAVATACMVMAADSALRMVESIPDVEALFIAIDGANGNPKITTTAHFPKFEKKNNPKNL